MQVGNDYVQICQSAKTKMFLWVTPTRPDAERGEHKQYDLDKVSSSRQQHRYILDDLLHIYKIMRAVWVSSCFKKKRM